jgi:uncharacterized protein YbbC (DUF1343 family)/CubicO group peptidase (beta-lactamase class C family)
LAILISNLLRRRAGILAAILLVGLAANDGGTVGAALCGRPSFWGVAGAQFDRSSDRLPNVRPAHLSVAPPESVGMSAKQLALIDEAINSAVERKEVPGAVALIARHGKIVYRKAFGNRALEPSREAMTVDTVFDLASLTKVVATATSMMILVERGKVSLADAVALYVPEFGRMGKERITVEQLLTHRAGLPPDNDIADYIGVSVNPLENIYNLRPSYEPGSRFLYSDVGYIVAGEIIRRVSGKTLDQFTAENIFKPLGMSETAFLQTPGTASSDEAQNRPAVNADGAALNDRESMKSRVATTENRDGRWMRGEVHDPRSYALGGVAGHAGLFSTADDLAVFCQMMLNGGEYGGARILSPYTVERMISAGSLPPSELRGIGWDINTSFSSNRGDLFPVGTFGHTGFTGTSIWIDPSSKTFVVLLTDRVHLGSSKGNDGRLRSQVASIAAGAIIAPPYASILNPSGSASPNLSAGIPRAPLSRAAPAGPLHPVLTGIDVLERDRFKQLEGRHVGLITNHTGRDLEGRSTVDVLAAAPNLKLVALFSPEHGLRGIEDTNVGDARDPATGLPIYSLYEKDRRRPSPEMLAGIDTLVFDIQDVGTRFYTYMATCGYAMEEAARNKIKFVVLDRPDPINGYDIEGPVADDALTSQPGFSFTSYHPIPVRYGLTIGELAGLFNSERKIGADLTVIKMEGWRRADYYDGTALTWINPSPNMRSLTEALLYPGIGLLETTNVSVGRGTDTPFEIIGAPWIDGKKLAEALNRAEIPGARFVPVSFTPKSSKFSGETCGGVNVVVTDRSSVHPVALGIAIAYELNRLYAGKWQADQYLRLLANQAVLDSLKQGKSPAEIAGVWQPGLAAFAQIRRKYMLY